MKLNDLGFGLFAIGMLCLALVQIQAASAIGANLENPTIRDMYVGFAMSGLLARGEGANHSTVVAANQIAKAMMDYRSGK